MKFAYRITLTLFLIFIFFFVAPFVLLYTSGYRYDSKQFSLVKTGLISVKTIPRDATISINQEKQKQRTPTKISNVIPDTYVIEISKPGYHTWKKRLPVYSQQSTLIEHVYLYKKEDFVNALTTDTIVNAWFVKNGVFYLQEDSPKKYLLLYYAYDAKTYHFIDSFSFIPPIAFNPSMDILYYVKDQTIIIRSLSNLQMSFRLSDYISTSPLQLNDISLISWNPHKTQNAYIVFQGILYNIDFQQNSLAPVREFNHAPFLVYNNAIFYLTHSQTNSYLTKMSLNEASLNILPMAKLPLTKNYHFQAYTRNDLISLLDKQNDMLFILNPRTQSVKPIIESIFDVQGTSWNTNYTQLMYFNDFEIWTWDIRSENSTLVNRFSQKLTNAHLLSHGDILFAFEKEIYVMEQDRRDTPNIIHLMSFDHIKKMSVNEKQDMVYVFGTKNGKEGIYSLRIQER